MRRRTLVALGGIVALVMTLASPGLASAMWTPVNFYMFQTQHVCRDGLVIDLAYNDPAATQNLTSWPMTVWVYDPATHATASKGFTVPRSTTTSAPDMLQSGFHAMYLSRNNKFPWTTARAPGSQVSVAAGTQDYRVRTVENCSINTRLDPFAVGYVWAHTPTPTPTTYYPDQYWSYNSTMQANSVTRTGTGTYTVSFPGLAGTGGNAQVTAYGPVARVCKLANPPMTTSGTTLRLNVRCFSAGSSGVPADAQFTASYTAGYGTANTLAFLLADQPASASYRPNPTYQYNNSGGYLSVSRQSTGKYTVFIPTNSLAPWGGSVKVTAVGTTNTDCKVRDWFEWDYTEYVDVWCFGGNGLPADSMFSMAYVYRMNLLGNNLMADGYVLSDDEEPSMNSYYSPSTAYQRSATISESGNVYLRREYPGDYPAPYDVLLTLQNSQQLSGNGASWDGGNVQVTAYGVDEYGNQNHRCQVGNWTDDMWVDGQNYALSGRRVRVYCFDAGGNPAQSQFTLQYTGQLQ
ncbi:hypothetical protein [Actinophytocola sp.]|uniref:hypothetical protein n=1 Tax=Actinophytocola sp. TaxID=1872138 RepID=UPI00389A857A